MEPTKNIENEMEQLGLEDKQPEVPQPPQEHPDYENITVDYVKDLQLPADRFLCKLTDNWPVFKFQGFSIRDCDSKMTLVTVPAEANDKQLSDDDNPETRVVKYHLGPQFLLLRTVGLNLEFSVGPKEVKNMQMVEKHYFRGRVIREYSFDFGFIIPGSCNTWDFVYDLPELSPEDQKEIIEAPWEVKSDSYFFAEGKLIIHTRAIYNY